MQYDNNMKGSIWLKKAKSGLTYMGGEVTINNQKYYISMFKNTKKVVGSSQPDYNIVLNLPQGQSAQQNTQQNVQAVNQVFNQLEPKVNELDNAANSGMIANPFNDDSDVPF